MKNLVKSEKLAMQHYKRVRVAHEMFSGFSDKVQVYLMNLSWF